MVTRDDHGDDDDDLEESDCALNGFDEVTLTASGIVIVIVTANDCLDEIFHAADCVS